MHLLVFTCTLDQTQQLFVFVCGDGGGVCVCVRGDGGGVCVCVCGDGGGVYVCVV